MAILTLSGCFPTGEKKPSTSIDFLGDEFFEFSKDNIETEFEIPKIPNGLPTRIKLKEKAFDTEEMLALFFSGKTIIPEETWFGNYYADDDSHLYVGSNSISFYEGDMAKHTQFQLDAPLNYQAVLCVDEEYYRDVFDIGCELESFSSQSATDRAMKLFSTLGITGLGEPSIYAFSLDTLTKLKESDLSFAFNEEFPLTEDNEVYILHFSQLFNGTELAKVNDSIKDNTDKSGSFHTSHSKVTIGISKDKIFYFDAEGVYETEYEYEILSSEPPKYDLNYALSEFSNYLDNAHFSSEVVINKVKQVYFPVERNNQGYIEYSLAWCFEGTIKESPNNYRKNDYRIFFSAETGIRSEYK